MDDKTTTQTKAKMLKVLDITRTDLSTIRSGRATPALVDHIEIMAYGTQKMKVQELATVTTSDTKTILIHPFDPSTQEDIIRGILEANVGLTPVSENADIRISIPSLTAERREEYLKLAKTKIEAGKIMIRQVRHEEMNVSKRRLESNEITEDEKDRIDKNIQELTDEMIAELDHFQELKEKELRQI